eukprot:18981-Eustigmatos_ZCMA.PRE.1
MQFTSRQSNCPPLLLRRVDLLRSLAPTVRAETPPSVLSPMSACLQPHSRGSLRLTRPPALTTADTSAEAIVHATAANAAPNIATPSPWGFGRRGVVSGRDT